MAPTEHTPLIAVVALAPPRDRYPHHTLRRFCTIALAVVPVIVLSTLVVSLVISIQSDLFDSDSLHLSLSIIWPKVTPHESWPQSKGVSYKELQEILIDTPKAEKAREWSQYYTSGPHLAGKNLSQAVWTKERWEEFGVKSDVVSYDVYVNYPLGHRLALLEKHGKSKRDLGTADEEEHTQGNGWEVKYEASLEEDVLEEDPTTGLPNRIPTFHGYSASGNVTAQYVYVNYGTYQDYEDLVKAKVDLAGKIALIKYGGIFRGLKIKRASELGMIGAVIYSDPGDDGAVTSENGTETYPEGPAREPSSVQRGSAQYLSVAPGDPTTPGYPSLPGVPRQSVNGSIPDIPSIPISYLDALPLLKALNGHGPKASSFGKEWHTGGLGYKGVEYNIGPSPPNLALNLVNEQEYVTTPMWNVIGIINGTIPDEVVILGNHRDAWIVGGAGDPNSGSAALNEVIRSFGVALQKGWKPLRTIVFASWDGEEYGLIGSTEWVEEYIPWLSHAAVAYLNVDVGTTGSHFTAAAAPLLNKALIEITQLVPSPNQTVAGQTVGDVWNGHIRTMGSGSDFTAFQDFAGIPCVDMGFNAGPGDAVYHYHSNYDSFAWMDRFGDPGFHYHVTITKLWALLAAKIVETPVVQFNATDYAVALAGYLDSVKAKGTALSADPDIFAFRNLTAAIANLHAAAATFDAHASSVSHRAFHASTSVPWYSFYSRARLYAAVRSVNTKYKTLERQFLYAPGLDGRAWFKHVVFAPGLWTGYAGATFPGLVEGLDAGDRQAVRRWEGIITELVEDATALLGKGN
ncbi:peptidase M28 [Cryomyces antarcticus]